MTDYFESARLRLDGAKENIRNLDGRITGFFHKHPPTSVVEHDTKAHNQALKLKFAKQPADWPVKVAEILEHLRHSLDQAMYGASRASGVIAPKNAYFPFSDTPDNLENVIRGRCSDVPKEIVTLVRAFQPYKGGNLPLWALNKTANTKHTLLMPVGIGGGGIYIKNLEADDVTDLKLMVPRWNRAKNEIVVFEAGAIKKMRYELAVNFTVAFDEVEPVSGEPVIAVLDTMASIVESIVSAIEAESQRLWPTHE